MPTTPAASSRDAPSTTAHDASSDATANAPTTTSTKSLTRLLQEPDLTRLSPSSKATRILIGEKMTQGHSLTEIAKQLGRPASWVSERLESLRNELLLQAGYFFPLSDQEYEALRDSIERYGIQSPILIGEHIALLDGRHRLLIAEELELPDIPAVFVTGLGADVERDIAIAVNAARRQLTRAQKRTLIETELTRDPARSDRHIGAICGVYHTTVGEARREMAAQLVSGTTNAPAIDVEPEKRVGRDGKARRMPQRAPAPAQPLTPSSSEPGLHALVDGAPSSNLAAKPIGTGPIAYLTCAHGQVHELHTTTNGYELRASRD